MPRLWNATLIMAIFTAFMLLVAHIYLKQLEADDGKAKSVLGHQVDGGCVRDGSFCGVSNVGFERHGH